MLHTPPPSVEDAEALPPPDPRRAVLDELVAMGMDFARALHAELKTRPAVASSGADDEDGTAARASTEALSLAFARVSNAVRLAVSADARLEAETRAAEGEDDEDEAVAPPRDYRSLHRRVLTIVEMAHRGGINIDRLWNLDDSDLLPTAYDTPREEIAERLDRLKHLIAERKPFRPYTAPAEVLADINRRLGGGAFPEENNPFYAPP
jgi:hypothetical protein